MFNPSPATTSSPAPAQTAQGRLEGEIVVTGGALKTESSLDNPKVPRKSEYHDTITISSFEPKTHKHGVAVTLDWGKSDGSSSHKVTLYLATNSGSPVKAMTQAVNKVMSNTATYIKSGDLDAKLPVLNSISKSALEKNLTLVGLAFEGNPPMKVGDLGIGLPKLISGSLSYVLALEGVHLTGLGPLQGTLDLKRGENVTVEPSVASLAPPSLRDDLKPQLAALVVPPPQVSQPLLDPGVSIAINSVGTALPTVVNDKIDAATVSGKLPRGIVLSDRSVISDSSIDVQGDHTTILLKMASPQAGFGGRAVVSLRLVNASSLNEGALAALINDKSRAGGASMRDCLLASGGALDSILKELASTGAKVESFSMSNGRIATAHSALAGATFGDAFSKASNVILSGAGLAQFQAVLGSYSGAKLIGGQIQGGSPNEKYELPRIRADFDSTSRFEHAVVTKSWTGEFNGVIEYLSFAKYTKDGKASMFGALSTDEGELTGTIFSAPNELNIRQIRRCIFKGEMPIANLREAKFSDPTATTKVSAVSMAAAAASIIPELPVLKQVPVWDVVQSLGDVTRHNLEACTVKEGGMTLEINALPVGARVAEVENATIVYATRARTSSDTESRYQADNSLPAMGQDGDALYFADPMNDSRTVVVLKDGLGELVRSDNPDTGPITHIATLDSSNNVNLRPIDQGQLVPSDVYLTPIATLIDESGARHALVDSVSGRQVFPLDTTSTQLDMKTAELDKSSLAWCCLTDATGARTMFLADSVMLEHTIDRMKRARVTPVEQQAMFERAASTAAARKLSGLETELAA